MGWSAFREGARLRSSPPAAAGRNSDDFPRIDDVRFLPRGVSSPRRAILGQMDTKDDALLDVRDAVDAFVRGRTSEDPEDVVQETMARLLANLGRLEPGAWTTYAVVCATNLLHERARVAGVVRRHAHRLFSPDAGPDPQQHVLTVEEHAAIRRALAELDEPDAELLREHYQREGAPTRTLAPATAARLARARAKLRVSYVLSHADVPLPSDRCRPVLEALSSGDRRRQERLGAGRHLRACAVCASYAPALVERRRALAALYPLGWLGLAAGAAWGAARRQPARAATATVAVAALTVTGVAVLGPEPDPRSPAAAPAAPAQQTADGVLRIAGTTVLPRRGDQRLPVGAASATRVRVQEVPADEGLWVGVAPGQRVWVVLTDAGESPRQVVAGDTISFEGEGVGLEPGHAERVGLSAQEGSGELSAMGGYVRVRLAGVRFHES